MATVVEFDLEQQMRALGQAARTAARQLASATTHEKDRALTEAATALRDRCSAVLDANRADVEAARARGLSPAMVDRLMLDHRRIQAMAEGLEAIAAAEDPVGRTLASWTRPNGLRIERVSVPLGVIGVIYESRPNVTADAGALCLKAGNAAILRGGSESRGSSAEILACLHEGLAAAGLPPQAIQAPPSQDRACVGHMLTMADMIDVIVPRGGRSLVERVQAESKVPVFAHLEGICHVFVDRSADLAMATSIIVNAKMRRTGICGAAETLLVDRAIAGDFLPGATDALEAAGCRLRGDERARSLVGRIEPATEADWTTEYLDAILAMRVVDDLDQAIEHINAYGSHHTDSIVAENGEAAARFLDAVDSAIVMHNSSTQFADGGEFGMGAEIGISTGRMHARGPVGLEQLTTFKYKVHGQGQVRPA
ncbi:MAG: glutamate-5-semialdehyde dehydrogenase [Geminicoccaceae bacterium]